VVRWWLVLVVVGVLTGTAAAKREPGECLCSDTITLPRQGATDVPTNARFWTIPGGDTPDQPIQTYELAPHTAYELNAQQLSFTTGAGRDDTPPMEPGVGAISFSTFGSHDELHIAATFDSDTAVVRVRFRGRTYWTTPDKPTLCVPAVHAPDSGDAEVVAFDLAGNASAPVTATAASYLAPKGGATCHAGVIEWRGRGELLGMLFFILAPIAAIIAFVILLMVIGWRSGRDRSSSEPEPLAVASAMYLVRAIRLRCHAGVALVAGSCGIASVNELARDFVAPASPVLIAVAIWSVVRWVQARRITRLLGYDGVTTELRGNRLAAVVGGKVALLLAPTRLIEEAQRNALPRASL
jgi:hypothetical protein